MLLDRGFFELFEEYGTRIAVASGVLTSVLAAPTRAPQFSSAMKRLRSDTDDITAALRRRIECSVGVPFEIEDIHALSVALEDVVREIGRAVSWTAVAPFTTIDAEAQELAESLALTAHSLAETIVLARTPRAVLERIPFSALLAKAAHTRCLEAVSLLLTQSHDSLDVIKTKELYDRLDRAGRRCLVVARCLERIALNHA
jgi:hypothetical protein